MLRVVIVGVETRIGRLDTVARHHRMRAIGGKTHHVLLGRRRPMAEPIKNAVVNGTTLVAQRLLLKARLSKLQLELLLTDVGGVVILTIDSFRPGRSAVRRPMSRRAVFSR